MAKYTTIAPLYDLLSAEYPIYGAGRRRLLQLMDLQRGQQVLDIGCGTGLNFSLLREQIGAEGILVGIDRSAAMLARAQRKAERNGWKNIILIHADATALDEPSVSAHVVREGGRPLADAALATYSLSLMVDWPRAWRVMWELTTPEARLGICDMQEPNGPGRVCRPLAKAVCRLSGSDIAAHPWTALEHDCTNVLHASLRSGHVQVRTGSKSQGV
ncbi:class I SAM-dependent methyltransferase [Nesterenkonia natronophila]|uniref:Methyltransferase domain-containing protein n=1 Tax=Nesterenkonia natronophila TaxID=2174932 RepID=A0A3A4F378_9MICC|nr:methyltransferase domain-containing protein [Nesterenkonia natronophila]RJN32308.1 methyltransferase domain-containing protein [Nesterenkonia natronophila]